MRSGPRARTRTYGWPVPCTGQAEPRRTWGFDAAALLQLGFGAGTRPEPPVAGLGASARRHSVTLSVSQIIEGWDSARRLSSSAGQSAGGLRGPDRTAGEGRVRMVSCPRNQPGLFFTRPRPLRHGSAPGPRLSSSSLGHSPLPLADEINQTATDRSGFLHDASFSLNSSTIGPRIREQGREQAKGTQWLTKSRRSPTTTARWSPTSTRRPCRSTTTSTTRPTWTRPTARWRAPTGTARRSRRS